MLADRIYEMLTVETVDLNHEYSKYYAVEYPSFSEFLYWKYDIDHETLEKVAEFSSENSYLGYGNLYSGGDNVGWLIEGKDPPAGLEAIASIFEKLRVEATYENQN